MKRTDESDLDCDIGFNTLICEEDDEHQPYQTRQIGTVSCHLACLGLHASMTNPDLSSNIITYELLETEFMESNHYLSSVLVQYDTWET